MGRCESPSSKASRGIFPDPIARILRKLGGLFGGKDAEEAARAEEPSERPRPRKSRTRSPRSGGGGGGSVLGQPGRRLAGPDDGRCRLAGEPEQRAVLRPHARAAVEVAAGGEPRVEVEQDPLGLGEPAEAHRVVEAGPARP